jgi:hypothetical protein
MVEIAEFRREEFRERLRAMSDEKLIRYGKAARYMADPRNSADKKTFLDVYRLQLEECIAEWKRRHPKADVTADSHSPAYPAICQKR